MPIDKDLLKSYAAQADVALTEKQLGLFSDYFDAVVESNKAFNLTAITDENDFLVKHFADSLAGARFVPAGAKLCDVGSGAGFPGVPLAVARSDIEVVCLDSTAKKTVFVSETAKKLGISNVSAQTGRAEDRRDLFGKFDAVSARAVAPLQMLLEICVPLLKTGGVFIAYKTDASETNEAETASKLLKVKLTDCREFCLPNGDRRAIAVYKKTAATPPQYPRIYGIIKKKPL